jgi:hypothetical protein
MSPPDRFSEWLQLGRRIGRAVEDYVKGQPAMNWRQFVAEYQEPGLELFSASCLEQWGDSPWEPGDADRKAAGQLHSQIATRITTRKLSYLTGVEKTALDSVYSIFETARTIVKDCDGCRHFDTLAWDVINTHVRPFTAKWHGKSERGELAALDTTDEFRGELEALRVKFQRFDGFLLHLRDGKRPRRASEPQDQREAGIQADITQQKVVRGVSPTHGGLKEQQARDINDKEKEAIGKRRKHYARDFEKKPGSTAWQDREHAVALALSGGGIRSATFSLGVLVSLAGRGILPQFDYLSTVSGGGYLGSFLSAFLNSPAPDPPSKDIGLRSSELPFNREDGEALALRHIRHRSKYMATGSIWQHLSMIAAQLYGMVLNTLAIVYLLAVVVFIEQGVRALGWLDGHRWWLQPGSIIAVVVAMLVALVILRTKRLDRWWADRLVLCSAVICFAVNLWYWIPSALTWRPSTAVPSLKIDKDTWLIVSGAIPLLTSALAGIFGHIFKRTSVLLIALSFVATPVFFIGLYVVLTNSVADMEPLTLPWFGQFSPFAVKWSIVIAGGLIYLWLFDVNTTSPHRHYRDKLGEAYLIQPAPKPKDENKAAPLFTSDVKVKLSELGKSSDRAPYHLINCALNVPGSKNEGMQGRLTDFFLFSQAFCGSPIAGYWPTTEWEGKDDHLDLGTAMAISGAAAAPQMGLGTRTGASFWLALLNVRLGYWVRKPEGHAFGPPGLWSLLHEMRGSMRETSSWLHVSDGGHIENLGVYELLRRRCKYIVAIDGEQDPKMTFHALTTLQRLAYIDFGINIDVDLDDLRLSEQGYSRSHFKFCRIRYPKDRRGSEEEFGYLLYVKLSLTGNEGEFLRRYRLDEPAFPHHSTTDQLFSEAQYEAYRSLGEHVGDRLFLRPIVGEDMATSSKVVVEEWFLALAQNLLEYPPPARRTPTT